MDQVWNAMGSLIGEQVNHHRNLHENLSKLKRKWTELSSKKEDIESRMQAELLPGKKLKKEVTLWLDNVKKIDEEMPSIENEVGEAGFLRRASLGKRVADKIQEIEELHQKAGFFDSLVVDVPPSKGEIMPTTTLVGGTTIERKMEDIWACLMNNDVQMIGLYGMVGSGKTSTVKHINNRILQDQTRKFDKVIWVTLSKEFSVIKLQNDIAAALNVNFSGDCKHEDVTKRAAKLFAHMKERRKYVLILDDIWDAIDVDEVGIPKPTVENGCKILLTTRSYDVCRMMNCEAIKMELLSEDEAWNLFLDKVGRNVLLTPNLEQVMRSVAKQCARLPLAIITIARSMKGVLDEHEWRNVLEELKESTMGRNDMGKVLEQLKYSYIRLKDEKLQECLLYCALFPEDFEIEREKLIEYLIDEGIINGMRTRRGNCDKGHCLLNRLENACLLESCTNYHGEICVKMHDLVRDMALQIKSHEFMVEACTQLEEVPEEEKWTEDLERVSLMKNYIEEIPFSAPPRCTRLSSLLLLENETMRRISDSFFVHMHELRVLDLSSTGIEILPKSISDLESLTALLLHHCDRLTNVPSLAKLRSLKKLDLSYTGIEEVPPGMEMLVNLTWLSLYAANLKTFPFGTLSKLYRLQCLKVWWASGPLRAKWEELACLRKLETLEGKFYDLHDFNAFVSALQGQWPNCYSLLVGSSFIERHQIRKKVHLKGCSISRGGNDPLLLPTGIEALEIKQCHDMSCLCDVSSFNNATQLLKSCEISTCDGIQCVLASSSPYFTPLQSLEVLHLYCLKSLQIIINGDEVATPSTPPLGTTFSNLKELCIECCHSIKKLFTLRSLPQLQNLEQIHVFGCKEMEHIIAPTEGDEEEDSSSSSNNNNNHSTVIPKLRVLSLMGLPKLKSIISGRKMLACDSLQIIVLGGCLKLKKLPFSLPMLIGQLAAPPSLQRISISRTETEWWESLEWDHPATKDVLQPLLRFWDFN